MRILVVGATGFIGSALAAALAQRGHEVLRASRHGEIAVDLAQVPDAAWWLPRLRGVDAVVHAVGILREDSARSFDALHARAPAALFRACAEAGVRTVVQVSALGADDEARSRYHLSKKAADDVLRGLPLSGAIVQPSLVYGPGGASAALFDTLAASPVLAMPSRGAMPVQPVHLDDVVEGIVRLLHDPPHAIATVTFAGPRPMPMRDYLARLRRTLGIAGRTAMLPFPASLFLGLASLAGRLPGSFLDAETASMLLRGNTGDAREFTRLLGREPREVEAFVPERGREAARTRALLAVWLPVVRVALAVLWLWTAAVSFGLYPVEGSLALLARVGLHGALAKAALYGAAGLDLVLGLLTLVLPARHRAALWAAQMALVAGYTVLITFFLPEYWLHPYGPITKNLPILAVLALLFALDRRPRH